ncbi:thiamine-phosphate kinase [Citricoccus muralis]|uniref:thiamine-phosphate kinase n=2 Tax=Citricoccus TaxID=169133 RepID=UPI003D6B511D
MGDLGEHAVLEAIQRIIEAAERPWPEGTIGPGDDAAVLPVKSGRVVVSTDAMSLDRDFRLVWPSGVRDNGFSTGWKAAAQNLSDINAMGGTSTALFMALTMPPETKIQWVENLARGMLTAIRVLHGPGCRLAGGDLGSGSDLTMAVTVMGETGTRDPILRRSTNMLRNPEEAVLIHTGHVGWAAAGLCVLETPRKDLEHILRQSPHPRHLVRLMVRAVRAQMRPRPPLTQGPAVHGAVDCMMDVSDGLTRDSHKLAQANGFRAFLDESWVSARSAELRPIAEAVGASAEEWVKEGGEDYGLLGAIPHDAPVPSGWSRCGTLRALRADDVEANVVAGDTGGWDHFSE